jgi:hypothetical protein
MSPAVLASAFAVPLVGLLVIYLILTKVIFAPKRLLAKVGAHAPFKEIRNEGYSALVLTGKDGTVTTLAIESKVKGKKEKWIFKVNGKQVGFGVTNPNTDRYSRDEMMQKIKTMLMKIK